MDSTTMTNTVYHGVEVDFSRDNLFDTAGLTRMRDSYMRSTDESPQERFAYVSKMFSSNPAHAQRLYGYSSKHWLSYSTPILSYGRVSYGLPISCFLPYLPDTKEGLVDNLSECNWLSMLGGGVGIQVGLRAPDKKSSGVMKHLAVYNKACSAYNQGETRRGSYAAYLDVSHPEIVNFIEMRKPTGDYRLRCHDMHHGVNIPDAFMELVEQAMYDVDFDDSWPLICPKTKEVAQVVRARDIWELIVTTRSQTGEPYMHFIDTSNRALPVWQQKKGLKINGSNLCSEITLATDAERTAVCCLSSVNLEYYDEWKDNYQFIRDILEMLDNVLEVFIQHAPDEIQRARYSAMRERSVGIGVMGWHALLQKRNVAFESVVAKVLNNKIFAQMREYADRANGELAVERGEAPDAVGYGKRLSHMFAIAPTATSSIILGNTSPCIEPYRANVYRQDTLSGIFFQVNKFLRKVIESKNISEERQQQIWEAIVADEGSVRNIDELSEHEKMVFRTFSEIDQMWVIEHAADRYQYIDQGQSVNVYIAPTCSIAQLHAIHFVAWKKGLKSLYYLRSNSVIGADKVSKSIRRNKSIDGISEPEQQSALVEGTFVDLQTLIDDSECVACQ